MTDKTAQPKGLQTLLKISNALLLPFIGMVVFLALWSGVANNLETSLGKFPGPVAVLEQAVGLVEEHQAQAEKEAAFYERQELRNADRVAKDPTYEPKIRPFTGVPTFFDQIWTSLYTVSIGFLLASVIAVPLGIMCGLSKSAYAAINPLIQLFKPISPLAWLPLVTMVVSAVYVSDDPMFAKSFVTSAVTVALCCLWPTLINTAVGVSSVDIDLLNVSKVLRLNTWVHIKTIILPSSIPMIFTGLRLSLGIGWMVLIAAEMLAQNPGLGKFVWDEFQNGSSQSLARIMVAVLTIGIIGFALDRLMLMLQQRVSWDKSVTLR
ncbi:MAG: ABC transporter permease [Glaciecola sp.]|nr:ABC transporter permease [Glaciecola sp.]MDG1814496.1 ABC transporter permease [Glaciecola sp.]MDG2099572.1 ABC transporter permease [Glaciecola sp.]